MAEYNVIEEIVIPEVPKVLENEQINVYAPLGTHDYPGMLQPYRDHFEFGRATDSDLPWYLKINRSILDRLGTGTPIIPEDLRQNESGVVGLANSNYRDLHHHIDLKVDGQDIPNSQYNLSIEVDPHNTQKAIRERISEHNLDRLSHPYLIKRIDENAAKLKTFLQFQEGEGRIFTIPTWEELREAILNPSKRVFKAKGLDEESDYARLLDLVTGDTILVLDKNTPDFYVVTINRVDDDFEHSGSIEIYNNTRLIYTDDSTGETAGFLFTYGVPLTVLKDHGTNSVVSVGTDISLSDDSYYDFIFGEDINVEGSNNTVFGEHIVIDNQNLTPMHNTLFGSEIKINSDTGFNMIAGWCHGENRYDSGQSCDYNAVFGVSNDVGRGLFVGGNNNLGGGENISRYSFAAGYDNVFFDYAGVVGGENLARNYAFTAGYKNTSDEYAAGFGENNIAYSHAFVAGENNDVSDYGGAVGKGNVVDSYGFAAGLNNSAGLYSGVFGIANNVSEDSVAAGSNNISTGAFSAIFGEVNTNHTQYNLIAGKNNSVLKDDSNAIFNGYNAVFGVSNSISGTSKTGTDGTIRLSQANLVQGGFNSLTDAHQCAIVGYGNYVDYGYANAVFGSNHKVLGNYNLVAGEGNDLTKYGTAPNGAGDLCAMYSSVSGYQNSAGSNSTVSGYDNDSAGSGCTVFGGENSVSGGHCIVEGDGNYTNADYSYVFGNDNHVGNHHSVAIGGNNYCMASYSSLLGYNLKVEENVTAVTAVGAWNELPQHDNSFIVGVGTGQQDRCTALEIYQYNSSTYFVFHDNSHGDVILTVPQLKYIHDVYDRGFADVLSDVSTGTTQLVSAVGLRAYVEDYVTQELGVLEDILESIA